MFIDGNCVKAILFDSGGVLNSPKTGSWFIPPKFNDYVDENRFKFLSQDDVEGAFATAFQYLSQQGSVVNEEEEFQHFIEFYRIFSKQLPSLALSETDVVEIARDSVFNDDKFLFHDDVFEMIPRLSKSYQLGVVSDTWPSLERVFNNVGLRDYFSTFVMSSVIGVRKPHELMFTTALSELNIRAEEAVFIDDNQGNVEAAQRLGLRAVLMARGQQPRFDLEPMRLGRLADLLHLLLLDGQQER